MDVERNLFPTCTVLCGAALRGLPAHLLPLAASYCCGQCQAHLIWSSQLSEVGGPSTSKLCYLHKKALSHWELQDVMGLGWREESNSILVYTDLHILQSATPVQQLRSVYVVRILCFDVTQNSILNKDLQFTVCPGQVPSLRFYKPSTLLMVFFFT